MKNRFTKLLGMLLCLTMIVGMAPAGLVLAAEETTASPEASEMPAAVGDEASENLKSVPSPNSEPAGVYYIKYGGTGDGSSAASPLGSLKEAVQKANAAGFTTGDTVTLKLIKYEGEPTDGKWDSVNDSVWLRYDDVPNHTATVIYESLDETDKSTFAFFNSFNGGSHMAIKGPTVFKNVNIIDARSNGANDIYAQNYDLEFSNVGILRPNGAAGYELVKWNGKVFAGCNRAGTGKLGNGGTLTIDSETLKSLSEVVASGYGDKADYACMTRPETTVKIGSGTLPRLTLDGTKAGVGISTHFTGNLSIVLNGTTVTSFVSNNTPKIDGSVSLIMNNGSKIVTDSASELISGRKSTLLPEAGISLDTTDKASVYSVSGADNYVYAYSYKTNPKSIYYGQNTINIKKHGEYSVKSASSVEEIIAQAKTANGYYSDNWTDGGNGELTADVDEPAGNNYYVKYGGTGIGKSPDAPAPTVSAAINTINADGLGEGDTANIFVMQSDDWNYGAGTLEIGAGTAPLHHITSWGPGGAMTKHTTVLNITSYDEAAPTYLAATQKLGENNRMIIGGPTKFSNIVIVDMRVGYRELATNGYDVTFGEGTVFAHINHDQFDTPKPWDGVINQNGAVNACIGNAYAANNGQGGKVIFENAFSSMGGSRGVHISAPTATTNSFKNDVTIEFNNSGIKTNVYWGTGSSDTAATFEKNLNFIISNAGIIDNKTHPNPGTVDIGGGLQILAKDNAPWKLNGNAASVGSLPDNIKAAGGTWIMKINSDSVFIHTTETAGTFGVDGGGFAIATDESTGASVVSKDGILTVPAGTYTVTSVPASEIERLKITVKFDGKTDGNTYLAGYTIALPKLADTLFEKFLGWTVDGTEYGGGDIFQIPADASELNFVSRWSGFEDMAAVFIDASRGNDANSGNSADDAVKTISKAVELVSAMPQNTKKIVIVGTFAYTGGMPSHSCEITYTGDGTGNSVFDLNNDYILIGGPTKFENIKIITSTSVSGKYISVDGYPIVMGSNITTDDKKIPLRLGSIGSKGSVNSGKHITAEINSGNYGTIDVGAYYNYDTAGRTAGADIVVNGGAISTIGFLADGWLETHKGNIWTENVNIVINGGTVGKINIPVGDPDTSRNTSFEKALQIILNNGVSTALPASVKAAGGAWLITAKDVPGCNLELTDTAGTFKVNGGKTAVASSENGSKYVGNGEITLPEGKYEVNFVDKITYINSGDTITVYDNCTIDFANEKYKNYDGKVFIGWTMDDGSAVDSNTQFKKGDVVKANYIDFKEYDKDTGDGDFFIKGAQIRTSGPQGLRFIVEKKNSFYDALPNAGEFGTLVLPTDLTWGRDMIKDEKQVVEWKWDAETKLNFSAKTDNGYAPATVVGEKLFNKTDDAEQYTVCIIDITEDKYYRFYSVKGYIKYTDLNGIERVVYSDYYQTNLYKVALEALEAGEQPAEVFEGIKNYVEVTRKEKYMAENYDGRKLLTGYDATSDKNPNHAMYALKNGLKVREFTLDTGKGDRDPVEIIHFADTHLNYINQKDIEEGEVNTLSTYRGRAWLRDGSSVGPINRVMEYASFFDQTVITGDLMDYFSWGCAENIQKLIIDKDPSAILVIGNHEPAELMQQDMDGLQDKYTLEEKYARLQSFWPNDVIYTSRIVKNDDGENMVMLVSLDNQRDRYWAEQYEPFKADIEKAKELDIPILVFQHDPICTKNPNETQVKWFYEPGDYTDNSPKNNFSANFAGSNANDTDTMNVYNLIVRNSDVIKGVFSGHWHNHMYTEIYAQNEDGSFKKDENGNQVIIPQHTVTANAYSSGACIKITVK